MAEPQTKPQKKVIVKQPAPPAEPIAFEVLATAIAEVARLGRAIDASRLKRRAALVLLRDITGISLEAIDGILDALPELERRYLK